MKRPVIVAILLGASCVCAHAAAAEEELPVSVAEGKFRLPWAAASTPVTLQFDRLMPPRLELLRLVRLVGDRQWHLAEAVNLPVVEGKVTVEGPIGVEALFLIRAPGSPGYLLDGPFRWPPQPATYMVKTIWRKTIRGHFPGSHGSLQWVPGDDAAGMGAPCEWTSATGWECVGLPLDARGVVVASASGQVRCAIPEGVVSAAGVENARTKISAWGRLLVANTDAAGRGTVRIAAKRGYAPRARPSTARLEVVADPRVATDKVGDDIVWISGAAIPDDGWIEVGAADRATERLDTREVADAPADLPLHVQLQPPAAISGRITNGAGAGAPDAIVTLYRFAGARRDDDRKPAQRVSVAEVRTDAEGGFRFDRLSVEPYEIVALHPRLGRGVRRATPDGREIEIPLKATGTVVGRVVREGQPVPRVPVAIVPDLVQFAAAADVTELRGGEAVTGEDGRFEVALPARGASELRAGDERGGLKRIRIGAAESQGGVVDVGDIQLVPAAAVTFVLEGGGSCEILLTGPAGRTGLSVIRTARTGPAMSEAVVPEPGRWRIVALCGSRERPVVPSWLDITPSARDLTVRLTWPQ